LYFLTKLTNIFFKTNKIYKEKFIIINSVNKLNIFIIQIIN
jgi:hypothetical protein